MKEEQFKVDLPNDSFINDEIEKIIKSGVKTKESFFIYLVKMIRTLGFKNIFHDKYQVISLLVSLFFLNWIFIDSIARDVQDIYFYIFMFIPLIYLIISLFSYFNSKQNSTFEIEMVCKYNLYQILAVKMFLLSIACTIMNSILLVFLYFSIGEINLLRANVISITSLFLFSAILIYSIVSIKIVNAKFIVIIIWILGNILFLNINQGIYRFILLDMSIYIHLLITIICMYIYITSLSKLINLRRSKGEM